MDHFKRFDAKAWFCIAKRNKTVQSVVAWSGAIPAAVTRWNELNWELFFFKVFFCPLLTHSWDGFRPGCFIVYFQQQISVH